MILIILDRFGQLKKQLMKQTILLFITSFILSSCKKEIYGCTDIVAENYSTLANTNDGSCYYDEPSTKSTTATVTNWSLSGTKYVAIIPWGELTSDIIENGLIMTYVEIGTNVWTQLPTINYNSGTYSTTIEASITVGQVLISISNSVLSVPVSPGATVFKISIAS